MTAFWSAWIIILSLGCWFGVVGLLVWLLRLRVPLAEDGTTGHVYDGVKEYDKPMPRWWVLMFWLTVIFGVFYWVAYPGLGLWKGMLQIQQQDGSTVPWTSVNEMNNDFNRNNALFLANYKTNYAGKTVEQLSQDPHARNTGKRLFLQNCAVCHGSDAKGAPGFPNLTDKDWLYGGTPDRIVETIHKGRRGGMPAWQGQLGEDGVRAAAEYVLSLSPQPADVKLNSALVAEGKQIFSKNCTVCHGPDAKGNQGIGAPNLTDTTWLYGGDRATIRQTIRMGRSGQMPTWEKTLGDERINLIAAYVYHLSHS